MDFYSKQQRELILQSKEQYESCTHISALVQQGRAPTLNLFTSRFDGVSHSIPNYERYPWVSWLITNGGLSI